MPERESKPQTDTTQTDDWTALRESVARLKSYGDTEFEDIWILVPKLLDAYAELWEMSIALTQAVEQWKSEGQGGKLLVADESEVREFGK